MAAAKEFCAPFASSRVRSDDDPKGSDEEGIVVYSGEKGRGGEEQAGSIVGWRGHFDN